MAGWRCRERDGAPCPAHNQREQQHGGDRTERQRQKFGGVLRLYPDDREPVDIVPEEGLLVAFPATVLHEVTRVGDAVRDAVVDWFY